MGPLAYGTVTLTLENVLLPKDKVSPTPSFQDGLDQETEKDLRITGCDLIQTSGILLKLPQTAMATAQVLFQRFYFSKSFVRQVMETTAMACVYLASKIEEAPRRIRDVINVFHHIRQYRSKKTIQPLILDPAYIRLKSDVTLAERRILKELGFCVHVKHPHKLIVIYMQQLGYGKEKEFMQMAWNYMNDALRTPVFVVHTPESIACACIFLTARMLSITLPTNWFLVFDIQEEELTEISTQIVELYERPKINVEEMEAKVEALTKAYQETRESRLKSVRTEDEKPNEGTAAKEAPAAKDQGAEVKTKTEITTEAKEKDSKEKSGKEELRKKSPRGRDRDSSVTITGEINGNVKNKKDLKSRSPSPNSRKRRSPSPIIYSESPSRHKHKKRKKYADYSRSRSRSRERNRDRDRDSRGDRRLSSKKRRERTPDSYQEGRHQHHKRKYYHR